MRTSACVWAFAALPAALALSCRSARTDAVEHLPPTSALLGDQFVSESASVGDDAGDIRWWQRFEDPVLDELVEATLAGNLSLQQAAANVREADARVRALRGARAPSVDAAFSGLRARDTLPGGGHVYTTVLAPQLTVAWQADLFGKLKAAERARFAELLASESDRLALAHLLVAEAARFRVGISMLERRLALVREVVESRTQTLGIVEGRYERGVSGVSAVDVHLARENLAAALTALPQVERDLEQTRLALDVLLGRKPGAGFELDSLGEPLPSAQPPPTGIPAALLDRRPDLQSARLRVEAAAADVDVSIAALYPDLTLSATAGWSDDQLGELFTPETFFASLLGNLTAPLFAGGRLRAEVQLAEARMDAGVAAYAGAVLQAAREVEDALVAERGLRDELEARVRQRDSALLAENLARDRYRRGLESLLTVLETERRRTNADDQVILLQAAVWNARIDLHLALGGDWFTEESPRSL